ncbi:tight adherence protein B [Kytococcus aerolatus]|uniref:Tight adherence protein B n=1 Tax=Kytococcus aerolatus TaxID=592308 RepID=A0A212U6W3_9MICO|nr:type II secretion system F family protein [Kytococcus aerolatus]SNC73811.1 tight adherence protein B [Kytococcus aerolatus]
MVPVIGLVVALLLVGAWCAWPGRSGDAVAVDLAGAAVRRREERVRAEAVGTVRELSRAEPGDLLAPVLAPLRERWQQWRGRSVSDESLLRVLDGLASALRAGLPPHEALVMVSASGTPVPWVDPLVEAAGRGEHLGAVWAGVAREGRNMALHHVASAWSLSERAGAPLAPAVATAAEVVRRGREARQQARSAASGAMASMGMLSVLPVVGVAGAASLGYSPQELYLSSPLGGLSAAVGLVLLAGGWVVSRRLVARALRGRVIR